MTEIVSSAENLKRAFEDYTESVEKVKAFQFTGPHDVGLVLDAFGKSDRTYNLRCDDGEFTLSFPRGSSKAASSVGSVIADTIHGYTINLTTGIASPNSSGNDWVYVSEGTWIVRRWDNTKYAQTVTMTDEHFRRNYK